MTSPNVRTPAPLGDVEEEKRNEVDSERRRVEKRERGGTHLVVVHAHGIPCVQAKLGLLTVLS